MNKVLLLGRLCNYPELKYVGERNIAITKFTLAVNRNYKNTQGEYDTDFIDCECLGKRAEVFCQYLSKGELVNIDGTLRVNKYTNENGENRVKVIVHVNSINFIPSNKKKSSTNNTFNSEEVFTDEVFDGDLCESEIPF